jgi:hypothetical protein
MKKGADALGTAEKESSSAKHENGTQRPWHLEKRDPTPSLPPKMSPGPQNMKTGADTLGIIENESGSAKHENGTRSSRYRRKRVRERKT